MKKLAALVMLASLISIQVHSFVPHHHHDKADQAHEPHYHSGASHIHGAHHHDVALSETDHKIAGHDDATLFGVTTPRTIQCDFVMALPIALQTVLSGESVVAIRISPEGSHPYATGPPGLNSSRAPPAILDA